VTGEPYSKERQLSRGERRYRRKVASPKQWQAIIAAKGSACRLRGVSPCEPDVTYHHVVPRYMSGDDVADNIVPLCSWHHDCVTRLEFFYVASLGHSLTLSERAYVVGKLGEDGLARLGAESFRSSEGGACA
jgi:hypothetical protein